MSTKRKPWWDEMPWWLMHRDPEAITAREAAERALVLWRQGKVGTAALLHICRVAADTEALNHVADDMVHAEAQRRQMLAGLDAMSKALPMPPKVEGWHRAKQRYTAHIEGE